MNSDSQVDEKTNLFELAKNRPHKLQSAVSEKANLPRDGDHKLTAVYTVTNQLAGGVPMMINVVTISGERFYTFVYTFP